MKLAVFVKHVPDTAEADLVPDADGTIKKMKELPYEMNEWDRFALEETMLLKEQTGGTLTAFLLGPDEHEESLRRCLAVGADRAVRVWDEELKGYGPQATARVMEAALGGEAFDLVLCGAQSSDEGYALAGGLLAEQLGVPSAALVNKLALSGDKVVCIRELEGGWGEEVELTLPALVTIQTGINEPRYVSILGIRKARSKPIDLATPTQLGLSGKELERAKRKLRLVALEPPPAGESARMLEGSPDEVAQQCIELFREAGGVQ